MEPVRISLRVLIDNFGLQGWVVKNTDGDWLTIGRTCSTSDKFRGCHEFLDKIPEGESTYLVIDNNFYTEKGLRYLLFTEPECKDKKRHPYHLKYPYVFKDKECKEITMKKLMGGVEIEHHRAVDDIWAL